MLKRILTLVVAVATLAICCRPARADVTVEITGAVSTYIDTSALSSDYPWKNVRAGEFVHVTFDVREKGPSQIINGRCCAANGSCMMLSQTYCTSLGRTWANGTCNTICTNAGQCCTPGTGACTVVNQSTCTGMGGTWTSGGTCATACSAAGACCDPASGTCSIVYQSYCVSIGGSWSNSASCPAVCAGAGKCCRPSDGSCSVVSQSACAGGTWTSGQSCSPFNCSGSGRCCKTSDGTCSVVSQSYCLNTIVGTWTSGGSCSATSNLCGATSGSCCNTTDSSCTIMLQGDCEAFAWVWTSGGICSPTSTPCAGAGKCCVLASGSCSIQSAANCANLSGSWSAGATCATPCADSGSCCNGSTGGCSVISQTACNTAGGFWTAGGTCTTPCQSTGACCNTTDYTCVYLFSSACVGPNKVFSVCTTCDNLCPGPGAVVLTAYDIVPNSFRMTVEDVAAGMLQSGTPYDECTNPDNLSSPNFWVRNNDPKVDGFHLEGVALSTPDHNPLYGLDIILNGTGPNDASCTATAPTWLNSTDILQAFGSYPGSLFNNSLSWEIVRAVPPMNVFIDIKKVVVRAQTDPWGSCCPGDGHCVVTGLSACPGTWVSGGSCTANLCAPSGACCVPTGTCSLLTHTACNALGGGIYSGDNTSCRSVSCPATGACCTSGSCTSITQASCIAGGGTWLGAATSCDFKPQLTSGPLGTSAGACCISTVGICEMKYQTACTGPAYTWTPGTTCTASPCPTTGKCCGLGGDCSVVTQDDCVNNLEEIWSAGETTCNTPCVLGGSCCNSSDNGCATNLQAACLANGGTWTAGAACTPTTCASTGKCCNPFDGSCTVIAQTPCTSIGGMWTSGGSCAAACPGSGKCCNPFDSSCTMVTQDSCTQFGGTWTSGVACSTSLCADVGKCCDVFSGLCTMVTLAACPTTVSATWSSVGTCDAPCFVFGKCCNPTSFCSMISEAQCLSLGGTWSATESCNIPCVGQGRCCNAFDGSCYIRTEADCVVDGNSTWTAGLTCDSPCVGTLILPDATFNSGGDISATYTNTITIPASNTALAQALEVWIDIDMNRVNDLRVKLTGPNNTTVDLFTRIGGIGSNCSTIVVGPGYTMSGKYIFQDSASQSFYSYVTSQCPGFQTVAGRFKPAGCAGAPVSLAAAFGTTPLAGDWTLTIIDERSGVNGTLRSWGLSTNGGNPAPCITGACCTGSSCVVIPFASCTATWKGGTCAAGGQCPGATTVSCCRGTTCLTVPSGSCTGTVAGSVSTVVGSCGPNNQVAHCCFADFDKVNGVQIDDIFVYLNAWFSKSPYAKVGGDGTAIPTIDDIFLFLNNWFGKCTP